MTTTPPPIPDADATAVVSHDDLDDAFDFLPMEATRARRDYLRHIGATGHSRCRVMDPFDCSGMTEGERALREAKVVNAAQSFCRVVCPACNGNYRETVMRLPNPGVAYKCTITCYFCEYSGDGTVDPVRAENYRTGRAMREDRIARGLSVREEAARLGLDPQELNRRERGMATS